MTTYTESGLCLDLPEGQHFRFAGLDAYKRLKGKKLREMDFAWFDQTRQEWILLELKDYRQDLQALQQDDIVPRRGFCVPERFGVLVEKVTDSLLLLLAAWADTHTGSKLRCELPEGIRSPVPLKLIIALGLPRAFQPHLQALRDALNARLQGQVTLVDVKKVVLLDYARLLAIPEFQLYVKEAP